MNPFLSRCLSDILLDRHGAYRARVRRRFTERERWDRMPNGARAAESRGRLAALLRHAADSVPWFHARLPSSDTITAESAPGILKTLPVMCRSDVQADPSAFLSSSVREMFDNATGGSSGTPMCFKVDWERRIAGDSAHWWANSLAGWHPGDRTAMLWGASRDVPRAAARRRTEIRQWMENIRWFNAFDMGPAEMQRFHEDLTRFCPHVLIAYAGSLFELATFLQQRNERPAYPRRGIISSAEMITDPMRRRVEEVFGVPVFDRYGSREFGPIAAECSAHAGLHVNEQDCWIEIESPDPFRQEGSILLTYLSNYAMPFLRYDTGDLGRLESADPCACGRTTVRMAPVTGRQSDTIRTRSGTLIHGEYFTHVLYGEKRVRSFQFIQETLDHYRLVLEADPAETKSMEARWREEVVKVVGADSRVVIDYTDHLAPLPSGKRKFTISKLAPRS